MTDIDWFLKQSSDLVAEADALFNDDADELYTDDGSESVLLHLHLFAAWANWRNILLMVKTGMVKLTDKQEQEYTYLKLKFVEYANFLPPETGSLSI